MLRYRLVILERARRTQVVDLLRNAEERILVQDDQTALAVILQAAQSEDSFTQSKAMATLGYVASRDPYTARSAEVSTVIMDALYEQDRHILRQAAAAAGELDDDDPLLLARLLELVSKYPNRDIGWFAAISLGSLASVENKEVLSALNEASQSNYPKLRSAAMRALEEIQSSQ